MSDVPALDYEHGRLVATQSQIILPLSAASMSSLEARVADFANFDFGNTRLLDLVYTLGSRRTQFTTRGFSLPLARTISNKYSVQTILLHLRFLQTPITYPMPSLLRGRGLSGPEWVVNFLKSFPSFGILLTKWT